MQNYNGSIGLCENALNTTRLWKGKVDALT